jgi:hypothetical protein
MSAKDCLRSPLLSEPGSDGTLTPLGLPWEDTVRDCNEQIAEYDYWGDGSLRSPELSSRFSPYISSSPGIVPARAEILAIDSDDVAPPVLAKPEKSEAKNGIRTRVYHNRRVNFSSQVKERLHDWLRRHANHPYPDSIEVERLAAATNLTVKQIRTFFVNSRIRMVRSDVRQENALPGIPLPLVQAPGIGSK